MKKFPFASLLLGFGTCALVSCTWFSDPPKNGQPAAVASVKKVNADGVITNDAGQGFYVVKADFTPLFRSGPQQPNGPDQSLPKDTLVTLLKRSFGYSRVQLTNGLDGYVATEDLAPAPPEVVNPPQAAEVFNPANNSAIVEHYSVDRAARSAATSTSNAEALPELPEPRLEPEPTPIVKPDFRY